MLNFADLLKTSQRVVTILLAFCWLPVSANQDVDKNMQQMQLLYSLEKQALPHEQVVALASDIIQHRTLYTSNTLAKAYLLLAQVATNKGDVARAFQFATDGLLIANIDNHIEMQLKIKVAAGYYIKGKYQQVLTVANEVLRQANEQIDLPYRLLAMAYKSMAYALMAEHDKAYQHLTELQTYVGQDNLSSNHIDLLEILAMAYFNLGDYSTAVTIQQKLLNLRVNQSGESQLEKTYYNLATSFYHMGKLDDAYHAYWQANQLAEKSGLPIRIAYAQLGLGQILLAQQQYQSAYSALTHSVTLFQGQNLTKPYLTALIALAKAALSLDYKLQGDDLLQQALLLAESISLSAQQSELYLLAANMYKANKDFERATQYLEQYVTLTQLHSEQSQQKQQTMLAIKQQSERSRRVALALADKSELSADYEKKFNQQQRWLYLLSSTIAFILLALIWRGLKVRARKLSKDYDEAEQPKDVLPNAVQTKNCYQTAYKMARKYDYPLAIGYMSVDNWSKLVGKYNEKAIDEVFKTIATLINELNSEFNYAGVISDGEYLFLAPHWSKQELVNFLEHLSKAFELRFFANLGDVSLVMRYAVEVPSVQDIDPYIFLSRLSDAVHS